MRRRKAMQLLGFGPLLSARTPVAGSQDGGAREDWRTQDIEREAGITPTNSSFPLGDVRRYGAIGNGVADDTAALNKAFTLPGVSVYVPLGTYRITSNLSVPKCQEIIGDGEDKTVIRPSGAVTKVLSIGHPTRALRKLASFQIDGSDTKNAVGVFLGDGANWAGVMEQITVKRFTGSSLAVGLRLGDVLKADIRSCTLYGNDHGLLVRPQTAGYPTTTKLTSCVITDSVRKGCAIESGESLVFSNCDFESSGQEGVLLLPARGGVIDGVIFDACWFEDNWRSLKDRTRHFHFVAGNGTALAAAKIRPELRACHFGVSAGTALAALMDGPAVRFVIKNPILTSVARGSITVQNGAAGIIDDIPFTFDYHVAVADVGNTVANNHTTWKSYTPTYSSSTGDAATSFRGGSVTTTAARFRRKGKSCIVYLEFSGTLNAVTPTWVRVSLPAGIAGAIDRQRGAAFVNANGTKQAGWMIASSDGGLYFYKTDESEHTSKGTFACAGMLEFEIA